MQLLRYNKSYLVSCALLFLCYFIGFSLSAFLWPMLEVPLRNNAYEIHSYLSEKNFNPTTNVVRFLFFIFSPSIVLLIFWYFISKLRKVIYSFSIPAPTLIERKWDNYLFIIFSCVVSYSLFSLSSRYFNTIGLIHVFQYDFYHEGEWLAPALQYLHTGKIWTGTHFVHGAFYDVFSALLGWKIFGIISIGAERLALGFLQILPDLSFYLFILFFSMLLKKKSNAITAIIFGALLLACYNSTFSWQNWERRDLFVIWHMLITLIALIEKKPKLLFFSGILTTACFFYTLDRGLYIFVGTIVFIFLIFLLLKEKSWKQEILFYLAGLILSAVILALFFGLEEMRAAWSSAITIIKTKDLNDGYIYPQPGFPLINHRRLLEPHALPMICIGVQLLVLLYQGLKKAWKFERDPVFLLQLYFIIVSILFYKSALSRADGAHFRQASTFPLLGIALVAVSLLRSLRYQRIFAYISLSVLIFSLKDTLHFPATIYQEAKNFLESKYQFINRSDRDFLSTEMKVVYDILQKEFINEKCLYSISGDPMIFYLLRKPSCSKYYISWMAAPNFLQEKAITELKNIMPNKILVKTPGRGDSLDGIPLEKRIHNWYALIQENYISAYNKNGILILQKK